MRRTKQEMENALPFAMEPVVYDFAINERGTYADLLLRDSTLLPPGYYAMTVPTMLRLDRRQLSSLRRAELDRFGAACRTRPELAGMVQTLFDRLLPRSRQEETETQDLASLLEECGFDRVQHEQIRSDLRGGRIGLAQNRLPVSTDIRDAEPADVLDATRGLAPGHRERGMEALRSGAVAVVTLAAGVGSRWTQGAGVVKALHPFCQLGGQHRSFIEVHLAKSRRVGQECGVDLPHIITTSYLTHAADRILPGR